MSNWLTRHRNFHRAWYPAGWYIFLDLDIVSPRWWGVGFLLSLSGVTLELGPVCFTFCVGQELVL